jgi:hypothetical protein
LYTDANQSSQALLRLSIKHKTFALWLSKRQKIAERSIHTWKKGPAAGRCAVGAMWNLSPTSTKKYSKKSESKVRKQKDGNAKKSRKLYELIAHFALIDDNISKHR